MDFGIVFGIVLGIVLIFLGITTNGGSILAYFDVGSVLVVLGGTLASTLVHFRFSQVKDIVKLTRIALTEDDRSPHEAIRLLVGFAQKARREGLLAMEEDAEALEDHFLRKGIRLVVDGTDPDTVRQILDIEITFLEERHRSGQKLFQHMGAVAPAFGMLGTLIGLINMLGNLDNPETIGPAMAIALVTTFYGLILANLVFIPIAGKLRVKSEQEVLLREVMIEGILSIQAGENPYIVEQKLESFLPPYIRQEPGTESAEPEENAQERLATSGVR